MRLTSKWAPFVLVLTLSACGDDDDGPQPDGAAGDGGASDGPGGSDVAVDPDMAGNGGDGPTGDAPAGSDGAVTGARVVGAAGGQVVSDDGRLTLQIPRGALSSLIEFSITRVATPPAGVLGQAYDIAPEGTRFAVPATVVYKYAAADLGGADAAQARVATWVAGRWSPLTDPVSDTGASTVRGATQHLSRFALVAGVCQTCTTTCMAATCRFGVDEMVPGSGVAGRCLAYGNGCSRCVPMCDADGDGYCPGNPGNGQNGGDCNDGNPAIHPGTREICGNGVDDDCNGHEDEGCRPCSKDADCPTGLTACIDGVCRLCEGGCDMASCRFGARDEPPSPGVAGKCATYGKGCTRCVPTCDMDGDGFCPGASPGNDQKGGDCKDDNALVHPDAKELCGNNTDDDCDGLVDEGCTACDKDSDCPMSQICDAGLCQGCPAACQADKCRFGVDEMVPSSGVAGKCLTAGNGCSLCVPACDGDGDGYCPGNPGNGQPGGDCKDSDGTVNPGASEVCGNGQDDNCNGHTDEGCRACTKDAECTDGLQACTDGFCRVCEGGCDMTNCRFGAKDDPPTPGVPGKCAAYGKGCNRCVPACDMDGDGFCPGANPGNDQPGGDCNDNDASVGPRAVEVCGNMVDDDCNGKVDDGCASCATAMMCGTTESCSSGK